MLVKAENELLRGFGITQITQRTVKPKQLQAALWPANGMSMPRSKHSRNAFRKVSWYFTNLAQSWCYQVGHSPRALAVRPRLSFTSCPLLLYTEAKRLAAILSAWSKATVPRNVPLQPRTGFLRIRRTMGLCRA